MRPDNHIRTAPGSREDLRNGDRITREQAKDRTPPTPDRIWTRGSERIGVTVPVKEAEYCRIRSKA